MTRLPGSASGPRFAAPHSPWPRPFAPPAPQRPRPLCSPASSLPRQVRLLHRTHCRLRPPAFPTTSRPRLAGTAMETSRFPCKRLLRMPGSTTTRGRHVSCGIDTRRVAFCGTENIGTPNLSYAAQYLACALPCERFTPALAGSPCITRGRCGSLLLHRDGLPPSTSCRSPGAPVHTWPIAPLAAVQHLTRCWGNSRHGPAPDAS